MKYITTAFSPYSINHFIKRRQPMKIKTNTKNKKEKIILYGRNKQNLYNQN